MNNKTISGETFEKVHEILALSDEEFQLASEVLLLGLQKALNDTNARLALLKEVEKANIDTNELIQDLISLVSNMDEEFGIGVGLSEKKKDFLKSFFSHYINVLALASNEYRNVVKVPIQKLREDAIIPTYAKRGDAGMDVRAIEDVYLAPGETKIIPTGLSVAIPVGYEIQVRPRSGLSAKTNLRFPNSPGTIDAGYRGEIGIIAQNITPVITDIDMDLSADSVIWGEEISIRKGTRIAQLVLKEVPACSFYEVSNINTIPGDREGGFGSTGKA